VSDAARKPWTSPSRLSTFRECPRKYRFQHVEKLPTKPSPHMDLGSNVHAALRDWFRLPRAERTWERMLELYRAAWRTNMPAFRARSRDELREFGERGKEMLRRFVAETPAELEPVAIEKWVGLDFGDLEVKGKVDRVDLLPDGSLRVVDYKTGKFPRDPEQVRTDDLAAAVYAGGASRDFVGAPVGEIEYLYLAGMERLTFPVDEAWRAERERSIGELARSVRAAEESDTFPPTPTKLCAWCDFLRDCPAGQAFLDARGARR
jgi:putative RecB family exonuclease